MCKRNLPRLWHSTAARKSYCRHRVVRCSKGSGSNKPLVSPQQTCYRVYFGCFYRLLKGHIRQNRRYSLGKHTFSRAGRTYKQNVVHTCRRNFYGTLCLRLSFNLRKVGNLHSVFFIFNINSGCFQRLSAAQVVKKLIKIFYRIHIYALYHCRLVFIVVGYIYILKAFLLCLHCHWQNTVYTAYIARKRKLPYKHTVAYIRHKLSAVFQQSHKYRQVVHRALLAYVCRCKINCYFSVGNFKAAVTQGRAYPVTGFLYRGVRQAHYVKARKAHCHISLYSYIKGFQTEYTHTVAETNHIITLLPFVFLKICFS